MIHSLHFCINCRMFSYDRVKHHENCLHPVVVQLPSEIIGFYCNKCGHVFLAAKGRKPYRCEVEGCRGGEYKGEIYKFPEELRGL